MVEFTGERVVPGQVNDDLWSEHVARYAFARRFSAGKSVLDAGCGTGYGSAELARSARDVAGIDSAPKEREVESKLRTRLSSYHRGALTGRMDRRLLRSGSSTSCVGSASVRFGFGRTDDVCPRDIVEPSVTRASVPR